MGGLRGEFPTLTSFRVYSDIYLPIYYKLKLTLLKLTVNCYFKRKKEPKKEKASLKLHNYTIRFFAFE